MASSDINHDLQGTPHLGIAEQSSMLYDYDGTAQFRGRQQNVNKLRDTEFVPGSFLQAFDGHQPSVFHTAALRSNETEAVAHLRSNDSTGYRAETLNHRGSMENIGLPDVSSGQLSHIPQHNAHLGHFQQLPVQNVFNNGIQTACFNSLAGVDRQDDRSCLHYNAPGHSDMVYPQYLNHHTAVPSLSMLEDPQCSFPQFERLPSVQQGSNMLHGRRTAHYNMLPKKHDMNGVDCASPIFSPSETCDFNSLFDSNLGRPSYQQFEQSHILGVATCAPAAASAQLSDKGEQGVNPECVLTKSRSLKSQATLCSLEGPERMYVSEAPNTVEKLFRHFDTAGGHGNLIQRRQSPFPEVPKEETMARFISRRSFNGRSVYTSGAGISSGKQDLYELNNRTSSRFEPLMIPCEPASLHYEQPPRHMSNRQVPATRGFQEEHSSLQPTRSVVAPASACFRAEYCSTAWQWQVHLVVFPGSDCYRNVSGDDQQERESFTGLDGLLPMRHSSDSLSHIPLSESAFETDVPGKSLVFRNERTVRGGHALNMHVNNQSRESEPVMLRAALSGRSAPRKSGDATQESTGKPPQKTLLQMVAAVDTKSTCDDVRMRDPMGDYSIGSSSKRTRAMSEAETAGDHIQSIRRCASVHTSHTGGLTGNLKALQVIDVAGSSHGGRSRRGRFGAEGKEELSLEEWVQIIAREEASGNTQTEQNLRVEFLDWETRSKLAPNGKWRGANSRKWGKVGIEMRLTGNIPRTPGPQTYLGVMVCKFVDIVEVRGDDDSSLFWKFADVPTKQQGQGKKAMLKEKVWLGTYHTPINAAVHHDFYKVVLAVEGCIYTSVDVPACSTPTGKKKSQKLKLNFPLNDLPELMFKAVRFTQLWNKYKQDAERYVFRMFQPEHVRKLVQDLIDSHCGELRKHVSNNDTENATGTAERRSTRTRNATVSSHHSFNSYDSLLE